MARQRGTTWQADVILRDGRRLRPGGFKSGADANLWEAQALAADERGLPPPPVEHKLRSVPSMGAATTLGEVHRMVLSAPAPEGWKGVKDRRTVEARSQEVVDFYGAGKPIGGIDNAEARRLVTALDNAGNSVATINRKLAVLSKMLTFARRSQIITTQPHLPRLKEGKGRIRFLTHEEEARMLSMFALMGEHEAYHLSVFLLDTGARVSEALNLGPTDIVDGKVTFWETKGGKPRTLPLTARARAAIDFFGKPEGGPFSGMTYWVYQHIWERVRARLGPTFADVVIHTFRHTCASRLAQAGWDVHRIMRWMGHADIKTTLRYAHLIPEDLGAMVQSLEPQRTNSAVDANGATVTALVPKRDAA